MFHAIPYSGNNTYVKDQFVTKSKDNFIDTVAYNNAALKVFYLTNASMNKSTNQIVVSDTTDPGADPTFLSISSPSLIISNLKVLHLYANSTVMVSGTDISSKKVFELIKYNGVNFATSVAKFNSIPSGYDFAGVIQQTTKEQEDIATNPVLVSFVESPESGTGNFKHYLVTSESATPTLIGSNSIRIASFFYHDGTTIYVLTTDGKLYHVTTAGVWTLMQPSSSLTYDTNAFAYLVDDNTNSKYHLVTKPLDKTAPLHVFSFAKGATAISSTTNVSTGYAKDLSLATIVSAQEISANHLLVATHLNGMYEITIDPLTAGSNTGSVSTSAAEQYTF